IPSKALDLSLARALPWRTRMNKILLACVLVACGGEPARPASSPSPRSVQVVRADRTRPPVVTEGGGTVRAVRAATIAPLIGGTVAEVRVGLGSSVRAGEVLVRLSAREVNARLEQARAASALARLERDRAANLREREAISAAQYDAALSQWTIADARQAEATTIADH